MAGQRESNAVILARVDENIQFLVSRVSEHQTVLYGPPGDSSKGLCSRMDKMEAEKKEPKEEKKTPLAEKILIPVIASVISVTLTWFLLSFIPNMLIHLGTVP
jgi:hypothetical protein